MTAPRDTAFQNLCAAHHEVMKEKGFWDLAEFADGTASQVIGRCRDPKSIYGTHILLAKLALVGTEVSEACEAVRKPELRGTLGEELADIVLRVMDLAEAMDIDLFKAICQKMDINMDRPHMHGGKLA